MLFKKSNNDIYPKLKVATELLKKMSNYLAEALNTHLEKEREELAKVIGVNHKILQNNLNEIIQLTSKKFILPIDREDIHALVSSLIYLNGYISNCANKMTAYKIEEYRLEEKELAKTVEKIIIPISKAILSTENFDKKASIVDYCQQIKTLTAQSLKTIDEITIELFEIKTNSLEVIKHLELLRAFTMLIKQTEATRRILLNTIIKFS